MNGSCISVHVQLFLYISEDDSETDYVSHSENGFEFVSYEWQLRKYGNRIVKKTTHYRTNKELKDTSRALEI